MRSARAALVSSICAMAAVGCGGTSSSHLTGVGGSGAGQTSGVASASGSSAGETSGGSGASGQGVASGSATAGSTGGSGSGGSSGAADASAQSGASGASEDAAAGAPPDAPGAPGAILSDANATDSGSDTPPWRPLNVTASPAQYVHTWHGNSAGLDTRSAKMAGKLIIDLGVTGGGYQSYLGMRGFHVFGVTTPNACSQIDDWTLGRDYDGDCRLNTLDGMPHGDQSSVTPANSIMSVVTSGLQAFAQMYPAEDWGYFLNQDGTVRWSDVGWTGFSHGASSAACFAHELRSYVAVSQSGPRDNTCGYGPAKGPFDPNNLPYDADCMVSQIASWLDMPSATPMDRYWGFVGMQDGQYGDDLFSMQRQGYTGMPVDLDTTTTPYGGSHRLYRNTGHNGFPNGFPIDAINLAFGVLPENLNPTF